MCWPTFSSETELYGICGDEELQTGFVVSSHRPGELRDPRGSTVYVCMEARGKRIVEIVSAQKLLVMPLNFLLLLFHRPLDWIKE